MMLATRNCAINKMADIRDCLNSHQHLLQLTSLGCSEQSSPAIQLQSPTPPDSPTPPVTPVWFQTFDSKPVSPEVNVVVHEKPPDLGSCKEPNTPSTDTASPSLATVGLQRALRSRRHRRGSIALPWPTKRLFTPDIKRMLKSWLVRRRDNPYPSRAEKESLAGATGLTYMQICNWFANWRRKLRNSSKAVANPQSPSTAAGTWGRLIKRYNARACAATAAEQFSISSGDSIWGADSSTDSDLEVVHPDNNRLAPESAFSADHCYAPRPPPSCSAAPVNRTPPMNASRSRRRRRRRRRRLVAVMSGPSATPSSAPPTLSSPTAQAEPPPQQSTPTPLLSKWLESAAKYRPSLPWAPRPSATSGTWTTPGQNRRSATRSRPRRRPVANNERISIHERHREELDAAEALTRLSAIGANDLHQKSSFAPFC